MKIQSRGGDPSHVEGPRPGRCGCVHSQQLGIQAVGTGGHDESSGVHAMRAPRAAVRAPTLVRGLALSWGSQGRYNMSRGDEGVLTYMAVTGTG